jgi:hypothetical protein
LPLKVILWSDDYHDQLLQSIGLMQTCIGFWYYHTQDESTHFLLSCLPPLSQHSAKWTHIKQTPEWCWCLNYDGQIWTPMLSWPCGRSL